MLNILTFLKDDQGNFSSMRLINLLIVLAILIKYFKTYQLTYEEIGLLVGILGLKTLQKNIEVNNKEKDCNCIKNL